MGASRPALPCKLFIGMISGNADLFGVCERLLIDRYGPVDLRSGPFPWDHSSYYQEELGAPLCRTFLFFERLIDPSDLAEIKHTTIVMEQDHSRTDDTGTRRMINLDPGYLTEAKVVLATTKDFPHRIYIGRGIYAESTLQYRKQPGSYQAVEHTYPDFRSEQAIALFNAARERLRSMLER